MEEGPSGGNFWLRTLQKKQVCCQASPSVETDTGLRGVNSLDNYKKKTYKTVSFVSLIHFYT